MNGNQHFLQENKLRKAGKFVTLFQSCPVKKNSNMVCCTLLLDNSGDETLYQQGGTDHEQSIHDLLGDIEAVSEISF